MTSVGVLVLLLVAVLVELHGLDERLELRQPLPPLSLEECRFPHLSLGLHSGAIAREAVLEDFPLSIGVVLVHLLVTLGLVGHGDGGLLVVIGAFEEL